MFSKIKGSIVRLIGVLEKLTAKVKTKIGPALKIGKIITAVYSVYAMIVLIGCGCMGYSLSWLTEYTGAGLVFKVMLIISLITLVLSGGVIEALEILLRGLECGLSLASIPSGSWALWRFLRSRISSGRRKQLLVL